MTSLNILLKTAMSRFMSKMFATSRYMVITTGVIHLPVTHLGSPGFFPHLGSISGANTSPYNMKYGWKKIYGQRELKVKWWSNKMGRTK